MFFLGITLVEYSLLVFEVLEDGLAIGLRDITSYDKFVDDKISLG